MENRKLNKRKLLIVLAIIIAICIVVKIVFAIFNSKVDVYIDAGHGGNDVGAVYGENERYEKDDNLDIAKAVKKELKKHKVKAAMTRSSDRTVSLQERCKEANKKKAKLFVSIHRNSAVSGSGIEIWTKSNYNKKDLELANNILDNLKDTNIQENRGIKKGTIEAEESDYYVNRNTSMPSCLIELGFISNKKDNALLDENINEYAKAIAEGIIKTLNNEE